MIEHRLQQDAIPALNPTDRAQFRAASKQRTGHRADLGVLERTEVHVRPLQAGRRFSPWRFDVRNCAAVPVGRGHHLVDPASGLAASWCSMVVGSDGLESHPIITSSNNVA
ncbi:MAG: hypothetical protein R3E66_01265 [bacterium]